MKKNNKILAVIFCVVSIFFAIYKKDFSFLLFILYIPIPFIFKLNNTLIFISLIFGFLGIFLGSLLSLFKITTWYDTFVHFIWGIVSSLFAIYILDKLKMWDSKKVLFNIIFIFLFSLATSTLWELFEFICDIILKSDMQRRQTGVYDTMKDIIASFMGNVIFIICFWCEYEFSHKLLIHKYIEQM